MRFDVLLCFVLSVGDLCDFFLEFLDQSECVALRVGLDCTQCIADIVVVVGDEPDSVGSV